MNINQEHLETSINNPHKLTKFIDKQHKIINKRYRTNSEERSKRHDELSIPNEWFIEPRIEECGICYQLRDMNTSTICPRCKHEVCELCTLMLWQQMATRCPFCRNILIWQPIITKSSLILNLPSPPSQLQQLHLLLQNAGLL